MREQASMLRILWKWSYAVATNPIAAFLSSFLAAQTTARFERNVRRCRRLIVLVASWHAGPARGTCQGWLRSRPP